MEPWPLVFLLLLLLLLWLQSCVSGPSNEHLYKKVQLREGQSLSVQCSYKNRRNRMEDKAWCKVKRKKCEVGFIRSWVKGPSYLMRDDAKAKVVHITMEALRVQDSGRYWCMRNTAGNLYPLVGFQLEVYPGTAAPTPVTHHHLTDVSDTVTEHGRSTEFQPVTLSPSNSRPFSADPGTTSTGHLMSSLSTTGMCHQLTPSRSQETYLTAIVVLLTFLPAPMVLVVVYGFWKKRHMGTYNLGSSSAKPWLDPPEGSETLWKPAWSKITQ
ncbi:trem-like transcript 2 protein isoform X3 [Meriones unguiculatus]|uniref:trem-like transcript 2 protein isoform X3 n=1 Tax=Meriones unguiculatus TaxID=10047 RepID=UPI00293F47D6|nr:trem-like transcript 2 protein isoform X3 [Meriones unguiculatus]